MALSVSYEVNIRHSKSDPLIQSTQASNLCHYSADLDNYPQWTAPLLKQLDNSIECEKQFHNLEDIHYHLQDTNMLTIEGLRSLYNSCFTCGVSWYEDHVSLDCSECGGYAMQRPCPECDGRCESIWRRDLSASHESRRARWEGTCKLSPGERKRQQLYGGIIQTTTITDNCDSSLVKAMDALKTPL